MTETREEIERRLAEIEATDANDAVYPEDRATMLELITLARSLLPALDVAEAAVNHVNARVAFVGDDGARVRLGDQYDRAQMEYRKAIDAYDDALAAYIATRDAKETP